MLAVVGRNGMGKTTLCNTIAGLKHRRGGSIRVFGRETSRLRAARDPPLGVGYVPQGRRVWPSLSVDEHLRLVASRNAEASWTVERIYQTFPRLAERRTSGGAQLSGGEQQMLAICRALLGNPRLLIMDEPTEGLAPVIVEQVERMLVQLAEEGEIAVLLIEQNIGVATAVSDHVAIMVNGRINRIMDAGAPAARPRPAAAPARRRPAGRGPSRRCARRRDGARRRGGRWPQVYRVERGGRATDRSVCRRRQHAPQPGPARTAGTMPAADLRQPLVEARAATSRRWREGLRHPLRRAHRQDGARRRHLRHQGARARLRRATG